MTDKTDIREFRRFNFEIWPHEAYVIEDDDGEYVLFADANHQLEAERHKGDLWFGKVADLEAALKAERQRVADLVLHVNTQANMREKAVKERDDLKSAHGNMVTRCALLRQRTDLPVDRIPAYNALVKAQEEIAAMKAQLVNPVVLPAGYSTRNGHPFHEGERNVMIPNKHGDWLSRFDVEHALHVAGFKVECGETAPQKPVALAARTRDDYDSRLGNGDIGPYNHGHLEGWNECHALFAVQQKPVISKEKLCDWLEDNFDIDDSQRDAFANCFAHHCNCIVKDGD